jgi:F0F1-type ATP synthase assembly protein I
MSRSFRKVNADFSFGQMEFEKKPKDQASKRQTDPFDANLMNSGMYIAAPILMGLLIGYFGDQLFGTRPVLMLVFIIGGAIGAFYNLFKLTRPTK